MIKKIIKKAARKKKVSKKTKVCDIQKLSITELYSLYMFVSSDANRGFGMTSPDARSVVRDRQHEIEEELYIRSYGYNPFKKYQIVIKGTKPEDIDLNKVSVVKGDIEEPKDENPDRFAVFKN